MVLELLPKIKLIFMLLSRNGIEMHFATNAFGHYVLVNNLLMLLERSADGRIVIVSSGLYKGVNHIPSIRQLMGEHDWDYEARFAYAVSKLANCLHTVELAKRLTANRCSTKVYAIRPGFVGGTELGRETHWLLRTLAAPVIWMFSKNLDQGIESIVHCAVTPNDEMTSGAFYHNCQEEDYGPMVTQDNAADMWKMFRKMEELILIRCHTLTEDDRRQAEEARKVPMKGSAPKPQRNRFIMRAITPKTAGQQAITLPVFVGCKARRAEQLMMSSDVSKTARPPIMFTEYEIFEELLSQ
ncbi:hypothetical protein TELCIR_13828 [Teladorsagia circumcincta]|uniref:NAD dependent epimerase/dehydratase family protein n=1 Tax=Teladorsagia circumcincta TaxID=45464 RepID=A0A2G9U4U9_TELCI|nr:hypothetical protein TELCIR_13828 [Teladorsagia circumcincta]